MPPLAQAILDEPCTLLVPQYTGPPLSVQQYILAADPDWPAFVGGARLAPPLRWLPAPLLAALAAGSWRLEPAAVSSLTRAPPGTVCSCARICFLPNALQTVRVCA